MFFHSGSYRSVIRLGYVPLNDCAPLAVAQELGLFEKFGVRVQLVRQPGWASIRDMLCCDQLEAAHAVAGLVYVFALGLRSQKRDMAVPLFLSAQGNAITLSRQLPFSLIGSGSGLLAYLDKHWRHTRPLTFAAPHPFASQHVLLRQWLQKNGITANDPRVEIVFLPPSVMVHSLANGQIDGYCASDPWNSEAVMSDLGWCCCVSSEIAPSHPEKALLISDHLMNERADDVIQLSAALLEACQLCQRADFREELIQILHQPHYIGLSKTILRNGLGSRFHSPISQLDATNFQLFAGDQVNNPSQEKASWLLNGLRDVGLIPETTMGAITKMFRQDIFLNAERLLSHSSELRSTSSAAS